MAGRRFGGRTLARSQALQLLFQAEATGRLVSEVLEGEYALDETPLDPYGAEIALGCDAMLHQLDAIIAVTSSNWSVTRMPAVDRNLLRMALYEMLEVDAVDTAVAIDECVELAKAYGTDESSRFVNGLLGKVARRREAGIDVVTAALEELAKREQKTQVEAGPETDEAGAADGSELYDEATAAPMVSDESGDALAAEAEPVEEQQVSSAQELPDAPVETPATLEDDDLPAWARG